MPCRRPRPAIPGRCTAPNPLPGSAGSAPLLNPLQKQILEYLQETGGVEPRQISERFQVKPADLEREIAALRHMEKIRGELREGRKVIRLW